MNKNLAVITARGGSKRIPRKNIKLFLGHPIIKYTIDAALRSGCFSEVMVSTDDTEIADIAKKCGAGVPFLRSQKTSNDFANTADVICEVLEEYAGKGMKYKYCCCLYPTAPFISPEKIQRALEIMENNNVGPRDAIHISSALSQGINEIISLDKDFDKVKEIKRIEF